MYAAKDDKHKDARVSSYHSATRGRSFELVRVSYEYASTKHVLLSLNYSMRWMFRLQVARARSFLLSLLCGSVRISLKSRGDTRDVEDVILMTHVEARSEAVTGVALHRPMGRDRIIL